MNVKPGRNDPCPCASGKKYKACCGQIGLDPTPAPAVTPADMNQLVAMVNAGRYVELESRALELVSQHPDSGIVWQVLGVSLRMQGKDALQALERAAKLLPGDAAAPNNLGNALAALGRLDEAVACYRRALVLGADFAEAHNNLGNALLDLGQLDESVASYRRALEIKPDYAEAHSNLGIALRLQGRTAEAEASCRRALEIAPELAATIVVLAESHADQGQFAAAEDLFKRAISMEPELPEAWAGIARLRKMTSSDATWLAEAQRIAGQCLPARQEVLLRYAIGKYFDDVKDFEQAFINYQRANELTKLYRAKHDRQQLTRAVDLVSHFYDQTWLSQGRSDAMVSTRPVFIVGMLRSGTTLAEQILASHPAVCGAGELTFWNTAWARYQSSALNGGISAGTIGKLANDYLRLPAELSPH